MSHFEIYRGKKEYVEKSKQKIKKYSCENIDVYHTVFSTFPGDIFYADDWKEVIPFSNSVPHILLLRLFEPYNKECYEDLKRICPFHKLAYKRAPEEFALKGTFYDVIFNK